MNKVLVGRTSDVTDYLANPGNKTVKQLFEAIGKPEYAEGTIKIDGRAATANDIVPADAKTVLSAVQLKGNK